MALDLFFFPFSPQILPLDSFFYDPLVSLLFPSNDADSEDGNVVCVCVLEGQDLCHTTAIIGISYFSIQNAPKGHYVVLKNKVKLNFNIKNKDFFFFSSLTEEQAFLRGK